jgi:hypothetical protein
MWRYDAARTAASPVSLPAELHLQWVRDLPKPAPAWSEEQYKLQFDRSYEPVVMGRQIFVPSMVSDQVVAYDTDTGKQNWQFFCAGPVRFAPIAWQGRVYFVSDDGCLLSRRQRGERPGNSPCAQPQGVRQRLADFRRLRGPVLQDGRIAPPSIWPSMVSSFTRAPHRQSRLGKQRQQRDAFPQPHNVPPFPGWRRRVIWPPAPTSSW